MNLILDKKHRNTEQRQIILEELKKCCSHPTASELHALVQKRLPNIGIATIYRNLKFLLKKDMIIKLNFKNKEARYDGKIQKHCHIICHYCNAVIDLMGCESISIRSKQLKESGFQVDPTYVELFGICKKCQ